MSQNLTSTRTDVGTTALWIGFAGFTFASVVFAFLGYTRNVKYGARIFYYLTTLINVIASLAYLIMALGKSYSLPNTTRQFEWVRYAQWALVAPLTVVTLGLLSGAHWVEIFFISFVAMIGIAAGFAGAISQGNSATWPLYGFGIAAGIVVAFSLLYTFRAAAKQVHSEIAKLYTLLAYFSVILYIGYVIVWGVSEGGKWTTVDQELIIYTTLDLLTKVVFGFVLVYARESIARYGSFLGLVSSSVTYDLPIPRSVISQAPVVEISSADKVEVVAAKSS